MDPLETLSPKAEWVSTLSPKAEWVEGRRPVAPADAAKSRAAAASVPAMELDSKYVC